MLLGERHSLNIVGPLPQINTIQAATLFLAPPAPPPTCPKLPPTPLNTLQQVMLGVDRLDMIKGIPQKLLAFEKFLQEHEEWRDKVLLVQVRAGLWCWCWCPCDATFLIKPPCSQPIVSWLLLTDSMVTCLLPAPHITSLLPHSISTHPPTHQIAVPSRTDVPEYQKLRSMVHEIVGRINGAFGTLTYVPIHHLDRQLSFHELCALYAVTGEPVKRRKRGYLRTANMQCFVILLYALSPLPFSLGVLRLFVLAPKKPFDKKRG